MLTRLIQRKQPVVAEAIEYEYRDAEYEYGASRSHSGVLLVVFGWAFFLACHGGSAIPAWGQDPEPLDLSYVPAEVAAAVTGHPNQLATIPELEMIPFELLEAGGRQELGFNPLEVEHFIAFASAPTLAAPPQWGMVLRFSGPQQLSPKLLQDTEPAEIDGTPFHRSGVPNPFAPSFCLIEERTLLIAPEPMLRRMLASDNAIGPVHRLLRQTAARGEIVGAVDFKVLRPLVKSQLNNLPPLPPPLQNLTALADHLQSIQVLVKLKGTPEVAVRLNAADDAGAERMVSILREGLEFGKQMLLARMESDMAGGTGDQDPMQVAMRTYMRRIMESFERRIRPQRTGSAVMVRSNIETGTSPVLIALLLPAVQAAREAARRVQSSNNLKQIGLAMRNYHDTYGRLPAAALTADDGTPLLSWRVQLLPFLDHQALHEQFRLDEAWDSPHNRALIERMPALYQNPNAPAGEFKTQYLVLQGEQTLFPPGMGLRFADIRDGTSNTLMAVEADPDQAVIWTKPDDIAYDPDNPLFGLGSVRLGGFNALFADGAVRFISNTIDHAFMRATVTPAGGEVVNPAGF